MSLSRPSRSSSRTASCGSTSAEPGSSRDTIPSVPIGIERMATPETEVLQDLNADYTERYGFHDAENYLYKAPKGLTRELVEKISEFKNEPQWMLDFRLK